MPEPLTPTEEKVYRYLLAYLAEHSYQPSVREIGREFDIKSTKTVSDILGNLARKGWVQRNRARSRGLTILGAPTATGGTTTVPLFERLPEDGSAPDPAQRDESVTVDRRLVPSEAAYFVRVAESATRGVTPGALVLVDPTTAGDASDMIAIRLGERAEVVPAGSAHWGHEGTLGRVAGIFCPKVEGSDSVAIAAD
jgi:repressor LexA